MKKLLLMTLIGICFIGWRSGDLMALLKTIQSPQQSQSAQVTSVNQLIQSQAKAGVEPKKVSLEAVAKEAGYNSKAIQAALTEKGTERGEADKLMNFFARGKYE